MIGRGVPHAAQSPSTRCRSLWQTPHPWTRIRSSPCPGKGVGTSLIVSGFPKTSHTAAFLRSLLSPAGFPISIPYLVIVVEHPVLGALHVVVLIALHRPQEEQPAGESQHQRHRDQQKRRPHGYFPPFRRRSEFPTTRREDPAMKAAGAIGGSFP